MDPSKKHVSFFGRLRLAWVCLVDGTLAARVAPLVAERGQPATPPPAPPPERVHASALAVLGMLQREGRLIDFLQEDVATFADAEVGAAARVVHAGCRKVLQQCLALEPALPQLEGDSVTVPVGFDAQRVRLTGNVTGQPPFRGTLKHHGWVTTAVRFPATAESLDLRVLAAAEVEL